MVVTPASIKGYARNYGDYPPLGHLDTVCVADGSDATKKSEKSAFIVIFWYVFIFPGAFMCSRLWFLHNNFS